MLKIKQKIKPDEFKRGDIWIAELRPVEGHEQGKRRRVLVVQNDIANAHSSCITIVPIEGHKAGKVYKTEVLIKTPEGGQTKDGLILVSQIRTLDKRIRFIEYCGHVSQKTLAAVDEALRIHLGLVDV